MFVFCSRMSSPSSEMEFVDWVFEEPTSQDVSMLVFVLQSLWGKSHTGVNVINKIYWFSRNIFNEQQQHNNNDNNSSNNNTLSPLFIVADLAQEQQGVLFPDEIDDMASVSEVRSF